MPEPGVFSLTHEETLAGLCAALEAERQAEADYGAQARTCRQAGEAPELADTLETIADVERDHARRLAAQIAALGGTAPERAVEPQPGGAGPAGWLAHDLRGEQWAIVEYARLIAGAAEEPTAELMAELLLDELRHARWLKAALRARAGAAAG